MIYFDTMTKYPVMLLEGKRVLLYGCGGGYDIYASFFLYQELIRKNTVYLANYSFTDDLYTYADKTIIKVTPDLVRTKKNREYFPEHILSQFLQVPVYTVRLLGPNQVIPALTELCQKLTIDTLIAIDAGHDALLFGDEGEDRGSPLEDMISMVSIASIDLPIQKLLACVSAPTESIPWHLFGKHLSMMKAAGGFLGRCRYEGDIQSFKELLDRTPSETRSIPNECLLAAMEGRLGRNYQNPRLQCRMTTDGCGELEYPHVTEETAYYYYFDINTLVKTSPLLQSLMTGVNCDSLQVNAIINGFYANRS